MIGGFEGEGERAGRFDFLKGFYVSSAFYFALLTLLSIDVNTIDRVWGRK